MFLTDASGIGRGGAAAGMGKFPSAGSLTWRSSSVIVKGTYMRISNTFRVTTTGTTTSLFPDACEFREEIR
jgi:GTP-sensing pleiotropic transcriptional regulator CodY